jgi:hypothetical protein
MMTEQEMETVLKKMLPEIIFIIIWLAILCCMSANLLDKCRSLEYDEIKKESNQDVEGYPLIKSVYS